jgi:predicted DNA-binding transcriptional regulator AlpA
MKLLRIVEMLEKLNMSKSAFHTLVHTEIANLPKPVYVADLNGAPRWVDTEIDAWIQTKMAERDAPVRDTSKYRSL